jgi:L-lysine 6-transaminase
VQTGVGLTGSMWCWQQLPVEPDLFVFGKKTQVCGFASSRRIDEVDNVFKISSRINSTWGGNLVDMVRCAKYLEIIEEENLVENARSVGDHMLARLREMGEEFPAVVSNVRGRGLFLAFDLPDKAMRDRALAAGLENGLIALASGSSAIRLRPPLTLSREEADEGVRKLRRALAAAKN